jgi:hypothetical protein
VFRRISALALLTAFVLSCGGHWYVLQGIAWVNMVQEFSEHVPLIAAVKMTVSGQYPCKMCKAIAEKKQQEEKEQTKLPQVKKDFLEPLELVLAEPGSAPWIHPVPTFHLAPRWGTPPTPPPRA